VLRTLVTGLVLSSWVDLIIPLFMLVAQVRLGDRQNHKIESAPGGKVDMRQEYGLGLAYSPDSLESLQEVFDRTWQSYASAGLGEAASSNPNELREHLARSIFRAAAEGVPLQQIEAQMTETLCQHLYAAVLAL
jgi:hypothetical protein